MLIATLRSSRNTGSVETFLWTGWAEAPSSCLVLFSAEQPVEERVSRVQRDKNSPDTFWTADLLITATREVSPRHRARDNRDHRDEPEQYFLAIAHIPELRFQMTHKPNLNRYSPSINDH
jgi:hypothetical protein